MHEPDSYHISVVIGLQLLLLLSETFGLPFFFSRHLLANPEWSPLFLWRFSGFFRAVSFFTLCHRSRSSISSMQTPKLVHYQAHSFYAISRPWATLRLGASVSWDWLPQVGSEELEENIELFIRAALRCCLIYITAFIYLVDMFRDWSVHKYATEKFSPPLVATRVIQCTPV